MYDTLFEAVIKKNQSDGNLGSPIQVIAWKSSKNDKRLN